MAKETNRSKVSRDERRGVHLRVPADIAALLPDGELEVEWKVAGDHLEVRPVEVSTKPVKLKAETT
jgi:hypothetical protein